MATLRHGKPAAARLPALPAGLPGIPGQVSGAPGKATGDPGTAVGDDSGKVSSDPGKAASDRGTTAGDPGKATGDSGKAADDSGKAADGSGQATGDGAAAGARNDHERSRPSPAPDDSVVVIVPGVARYHRSGCILIRFLSDGDLETSTAKEAEAKNCIPCRACEPEKPLSGEA